MSDKSVKSNDKINKNKLKKSFSSVIEGYHLISKEPLKESKWEEINVEILELSGYKIKTMASGSHRSGCDIECDIGNLSNKTAKILNNTIGISSYRLTTVCNNKNPGKINNILDEINKRNNSFDYYSLLARKEIKNGSKDKLKYYGYLIPKSCEIFDHTKYEWSPIYNKKNEQTGWKTNKINECSMKISFNMSSQLWLTVNINAIKDYKVGKITINFNNTKNIKYNELLKMIEAFQLKE